MHNPSNRNADPRDALLTAVSGHLGPLFRNLGVGDAQAAVMAADTIGSYEPETGADFVSIARTLVFSMAAVILLKQTMETPMPLDQKLRIYDRANALNRSAEQSEQSMMRRREYRQANAASPYSGPVSIPTAKTMSNAAIEAALAEAMREYDASRSGSAQIQSKPAPSTAAPATRSASILSPHRTKEPSSDAAPPQMTAHKTSQLRDSAVQRVLSQLGTPTPPVAPPMAPPVAMPVPASSASPSA